VTTAKTAHSSMPNEELNRAIAIVDYLSTEDGRELCVLDWSPSVPSGEFVTVTIKALIRMPEVDQ